MTADCVVVGAGPAGSLTALLLARAGFDVIVIDRQTFPRAKPCGDCISPQTNLLLDDIGLLPDILASRPAQLGGWRIHAPSGRSFDARFADVAPDSRTRYGLALPRHRFDAVLVEAARKNGARVLTGLRAEALLQPNGCVTGVRVRTSSGEQRPIEARLTIGADGLRSIVRQRLGLVARAPRLRKVALSAHGTGVSGLSDFGELHLADGACAGVAPVDAGFEECNLTLVVDADRFGRELAGKPVHEFCAWLERFPALQQRVRLLELRSDLQASGPFDRPVSAVVAPGAALVGDAAGYFDPFTGQGIFQALAGAQLLARAAGRALHEHRTHVPLHAYARAHRRLVTGTRVVQKGIDLACARPALSERCIDTLARTPLAARRLIAVTGDLRSPYSLLSPTLLLSFLNGFTFRSRSS